MADEEVQDLCSYCLKDENLQESLPCGHRLCTECLEIQSNDETEAELETPQCPVCNESSEADVDTMDHSPMDEESADADDEKMCTDHVDQELTHCCVTCHLSVCGQCMVNLDNDPCHQNDKHNFKKPTKRILTNIVEKHEGYTTSIHNEVKRREEILKKVNEIQKRLELERRNIEEAVDKRAEMLTAEIRRWAILSKAEIEGQADTAQHQIDDYRRDIELQLKEFSLRDAKMSYFSDRLQNGDFYSLPAYLHETVKSKQAIIDSYAGTGQRAKTPSGECKFYLNEEIHFTEPLDVPYIEASNRDFVHFGGFKLQSSSHISRFEAILRDCDEPDQAGSVLDKNNIQVRHLRSFVLKDWTISGLATNQDDEIIVTNSKRNAVCVFREDGKVKTIFALDTSNCDGEAKPVAALPDGSLVVGEFNSDSVLVFKQGKRANPDVIRSKDIAECRDIACDAQGQIIVACKSKSRKSKKEDYCGKVEIHDANKNKNVLLYSVENDTKIYFAEPISVAVNNLTNELIVADSGRKEIIGVRKDGTRSFVYSCPDPRAVSCDSEGRIFVLDVGNGGSIHILAEDGKTLLTQICLIGFKPFDPPPSFIVINEGGKLFIANEANMVKIFRYHFKDTCPSEA